MVARMMIQNPSSFMSDTLAVESRKAAILRDASLPDAPLEMPRQVIEVPRANVLDAPVGGLPRLRSLIAQVFGRTARGR